MKILEFRKINLDDYYDIKYNAWSRIYEYPMVIKKINDLKLGNINIHNTSWGFGGCHITFKDELDLQFVNVVHTDIKYSKLSNTDIYDITKKPNNKLIDKFDFVLNVSTFEEVNFDHLLIFDNLFSQVKQGGFMIITFDLPGFQIQKFEQKFEQKLKVFDNNINGKTSKIPNLKYKHLNCGILVVQKI